MPSFSTYNYTPLFNLNKTDFINLKSNLEEYIPFGEDNLLPTQLNKLSREAPVHRAILNSKTNYVIGKGLASNDEAIKAFIHNPNNTNLDLTDTLRRIVFDYFTHGNAYIEIVTNADRSFLYIYHLDASKVRIAANETDVLIHPDWEQFKGTNDELTDILPLYPEFSKQADGLYHAIYHIKDYEPEF